MYVEATAWQRAWRVARPRSSSLRRALAAEHAAQYRRRAPPGIAFFWRYWRPRDVLLWAAALASVGAARARRRARPPEEIAGVEAVTSAAYLTRQARRRRSRESAMRGVRRAVWRGSPPTRPAP